eukprot:TCONS_00054915-protein
MYKIIRQQQTIQRALREAKYSRRNYSRLAQQTNQLRATPTNHGALRAGIRRMATSGSSGGGNDAMLIAAGMGILGATGMMGYYMTNTEYEGPRDVKEPEPVAEVEEEVAEAPEEAATEEAATEEAATEEAATSTDQEQTPTEVVETPETPSEEIVEEPSAPLRKYPEEATYVIIGAGTAAHAACRAIRKKDKTAKILIIGEENALPYMRPPLSKELWFSEDEKVTETLKFKSWNGKERSVFFEGEDYYTKVEDFNEGDRALSVITGEKVVQVNPECHEVTLASGESIKYGKLLIATGGTPRGLSVFDTQGVKDKLTLFRNIADFQSLTSAVSEAEHVAVVGGGFLGSELACALASHGKKKGLKVTQIYPEEGNMAKVLPKYLSDWTTNKVKNEGVNILSKSSVKETSSEGKQVKLTLDSGEEALADHVVVCVGLQPNVELAKSAGLEVDSQQGGFRVNSELEARSDIWVAGDAACFYDINLGRRRVEHHDHAVVSGRLAGENMTGAKKSYQHQSMFWSDLGPEVGYEAIGVCDSSLPTVGFWAKATASDTPKGSEEATGESVRSDAESENVAQSEGSAVAVETPAAQTEGSEESFGKGIVFYTREKKVVGILLWNIFSQMPIARKIVTEGKDHDDFNALVKAFKLH